ncbi:MAG: M20/M25/M40 family metallo-hydrolase, partial [Alistipes sp.]|nr:M20/M25/M40 family metallo-hydrolase [Alistipes sp.]
YMASSDELHLKVHGTGGHGALPHTLTDPVVAAAALITALQQITSRNNNAIIPTVLSIGRVIADGATNIIPSVVELSGTLRTMDEAWRAHAKERIRQIAAGIAEAYGVQVEVELPGGYPCVVNHEELTERARCLARNVWGAEAVRELPLRMTAEDFGTYTQHYPSLFFRLGTARTDGVCCGGLHTATFNPDERALEYGVAMMTLFGLELGV